MRQNLTLCLLTVCATLLAVNLVVNLVRPAPQALGQAAGVGEGDFVLATGMNQSGNEAVLYIFRTTDKKLACYTTQRQGIELRGVRNVGYELQFEEFIPRGRVTVDQVRTELKKRGGK